MKQLLTFVVLLVFFLISCDNSGNKTNAINRNGMISETKDSILSDSLKTKIKPLSKLSVIVLPPHDENANEGISPPIQKYLESVILMDTSLTLIKFPYKQLINIPYHNIFDKKYCKPIIDVLKADVVLMSKIEQVTSTGDLSKNKWNFQIRIYKTQANTQINSELSGTNLTNSAIHSLLKDRQIVLTTEIKNN